jgi:hypothetical protein
MVTGTMNFSNSGAISLRPSIADSTEIAGVMTPSPNRSAAPMTPSRTTIGTPGPLAIRSEATSDKSARMPPSPSLSARSTNTTYLSETISISAQKISETMPSTSAASGSLWPAALKVTDRVQGSSRCRRTPPRARSAPGTQACPCGGAHRRGPAPVRARWRGLALAEASTAHAPSLKPDHQLGSSRAQPGYRPAGARNRPSASRRHALISR